MSNKEATVDDVYRLCGWRCAERLVKHFGGTTLAVPAQLRDRDEELRAAEARGASIPKLMAEFELSEHQVREVLGARDASSQQSKAIADDRRDVERRGRQGAGGSAKP